MNRFELRIISRSDGDSIFLNHVIQFYTSPHSYLSDCLWKFIFEGQTRVNITEEKAKIIKDLRETGWRFRGRYGFWKKLLKINDKRIALQVMKEEIALYIVTKRLTPRKKGSRNG